MKKQPKMKDKMRQWSLAVDERSLFEKLCDQVNLRAGFKAVRKNGGSPGIDGVTVDQFSNRIDEELAQLKKDLEGWSYKSMPLRNVVLDELDKELERRGLEFCRFADDCNIFVRSPKAADRVMKSISKFIEKKLKLKIDRDKSKVGRSREVKFLGMTIIDGTIVISHLNL